MDYGIVRTMKWGNADHTILDCMITFPDHNAELPFTATADDNEAHSREIFERAVNGDFGTIDEYVAPARDLDKEWIEFRVKRNKLLRESDFSQFPDIQSTLTDDEKESWANYRSLLRSLPTMTNDPAQATEFLPSPPEKGIVINRAPEDENIIFEDLTPTTP